MSERPRVLVTGATGFIGSAFLNRLTSEGWTGLRAAARRRVEGTFGPEEQLLVGDIDARTDWKAAVSDVDCVVHLAARVHVVREGAADALAEFRKINVDATSRLARQAAEAGVKRFVFLSTVKVNGEEGRFTESDKPQPIDPYAVSKYEAEIALREIASRTAMEVVIIRPPLVYGPGVKANFRALALAIRRGIPLPLGAVHNRRSLIAVDNLTDVVARCVTHPAAANEIFLVSDGEDLSTADLVRRLAITMGRRPRLIPVPVPVLMGTATILGRRREAAKLLGSLVVDTSHARQKLQWKPPISVDEGLRRTVEHLQ